MRWRASTRILLGMACPVGSIVWAVQDGGFSLNQDAGARVN